jgi:hypothetical protein
MTVHELVTAAQSLSCEQRKTLIKTLFEQWPKTEPYQLRSSGDILGATAAIR